MKTRYGKPILWFAVQVMFGRGDTTYGVDSFEIAQEKVQKLRAEGKEAYVLVKVEGGPFLARYNPEYHIMEEPMQPCPQCHGDDENCGYCDGTGKVDAETLAAIYKEWSDSQAAEIRAERRNEEILAGFDVGIDPDDD